MIQKRIQVTTVRVQGFRNKDAHLYVIYWFTYFTEQIPSWEANRFSASQGIPAFYGTRKFITAFTSARHLSISWASSIQSIPTHPNFWSYILILSSHLRLGLPSPGPRLCLWIFRNKIRFNGEKLLALRPTPKLEDNLLSAVSDCLFNTFAATLHTGGRSSIRNLRTRHAVVTETHLSRITRFNVKKFYVLPTESIQLCVLYRTNSDYFPTQQ